MWFIEILFYITLLHVEEEKETDVENCKIILVLSSPRLES